MYGSFLRSVRESRGMTQAQLAEVSGVTQSNISAIERGRRVPGIDTVNRLLVACGYDLAAVAGDRVLRAPLPRIGWFSDEDFPPSDPSDPPDEPPVVTQETPIEERVAVLMAVLEASELP